MMSEKLATVSHRDRDSLAESFFLDRLSDQLFSDVTLVTNEGQIQAHRVILGSISKVFRDILSTLPFPNPVIYMGNMTLSRLKTLVSYVYLGKCEVPSEDLENFLALCTDFKIEGFSDTEKIETTRKVALINENKPTTCWV